MSRTTRGLIALAGIALILGLAGAAGRWWVGESWATVITMCCFSVLILLGAAGTRRVRRKQ
ncbi:hypothetical protein OG410_18725 [Streptomyces sp. NBC_00659]|uniref:hypothetical protein n=1 Tax=Streptomyces sp. NBC_00659 TaxID=2903669 RepID=UPI002E360DA6|nr:hypothetical protein [Streptomyces sp. NBC_00659]